ncbi:hypothetical protein BH24CHL6_BH24CHL6_10320 [soil metagenome]
MSAVTGTLRRHPTWRVGALGLIVGAALGIVLGLSIALALFPPPIAQQFDRLAPLSQPATLERLHQHVLRETAVVSVPITGADRASLLREHLLRENYAAVAPAAAPLDTGRLLREHVLRENGSR